MFIDKMEELYFKMCFFRMRNHKISLKNIFKKKQSENFDLKNNLKLCLKFTTQNQKTLEYKIW